MWPFDSKCSSNPLQSVLKLNPLPGRNKPDVFCVASGPTGLLRPDRIICSTSGEISLLVDLLIALLLSIAWRRVALVHASLVAVYATPSFLDIKIWGILNKNISKNISLLMLQSNGHAWILSLRSRSSTIPSDLILELYTSTNTILGLEMLVICNINIGTTLLLNLKAIIVIK